MSRVVLTSLLIVVLGFLARAESNPAPTPRKTLVVLGDSLTAGFGIDPSEAFPARLQERIREASLPYEVINAGVSGDTTAGGLRRVNWILRRPVDVLLIALGGNDGLRGMPPEATRSNLVAIIDTVRRKQPSTRIVLAGMQMPPNLGADYTAAFREIFPSIARHEDVVLIPHLLEGVGGRPELNLPDAIHPTPEGHRKVAANIWPWLEPVLTEAAKS